MKEVSTEFDIDELELTMPYSEQELTNFTETLDFDWDSFKDVPNTDEEQDEDTQKVKCPECGHEFFLK